MEKPNVLFLCSHNQARSQMAEAFLKKYASNIFNVYSAGFEPRGIHPFTKIVMEEKGYDLSDHSSKDLKEYLGAVHFEIVITVCKRAKELCPTIPGVTTRIMWNIEDPSSFNGTQEEKIDKFRQVRDILEQNIKTWLKEQHIKINL